MFTGEYRFSIDQKGRVSIPARYRDDLGSEFKLCKGFDKCINIYPMPQWEAFAQKIKLLPEAKQRHARRHFFSGSVDGVFDAQGRVAIPPVYRQYTSMEKEVVIIGNDDHIEIWSLIEWEKEQQFMSSEEIINDLISCGF